MMAKLQLEIASQIILTMRMIDGPDSVIGTYIIQLLDFLPILMIHLAYLQGSVKKADPTCIDRARG